MPLSPHQKQLSGHTILRVKRDCKRNAVNTRETGDKIDVDSAGRVRLRYAASGIQSREFMSTFFAKKEEQKPRWYVIDANNQVLGKVAVKAANILRGKVKPTFTRHVDAGDFVVVVNAEKVVVTGKKEIGKTYMT